MTQMVLSIVMESIFREKFVLNSMSDSKGLKIFEHKDAVI